MERMKGMLQRRRREQGGRQQQDEQKQMTPPSGTGRTIPLAMLPIGVEGRVVAIYGGRGLAGRLMDLGLTSNVKVMVTHSHSPGPLVVEVKDSRIALGRGVAMKIMVKEVR